MAATTFAEPDRNESNALNLALEPLRNSGSHASSHLPYTLSSPGGLETLLQRAGLEATDVGEVALTWDHDDVDQTVRAVLASAGGAMAIEAAGLQAATDALTSGARQLARGDGSVSMHNVFRYAIARKPANG